MEDFSSRDVYKFISHFKTHQQFVEFAKSFLGISDGQINDVSLDHRDSVREQKYQIVMLWKRKVGRAATMDLLREKRDTFWRQNYDEEDGQSQSSFIPSQPQDSPRTSRSQSSNSASGRNTEPAHGAVGSTPPLQQSDPISEPNQGGEDDETRDRAPTSEVNEAQVPGKAFPGDQTLWNNLSDQVKEMVLRQDEGYCDKVENLTVKICSDDTIREIQRKIRENNAYKIAKSGNRGYVLIINNNFDGNEERHGAKRDVENMSKLWGKLGCRVKIKEDLTGHEIHDTLKKIAAWEGIRDYDFLAIFLMSHGTLKIGEDLLKGSNGELVYVKDVLSKFDNTSCPFLHGKPKLFFFQFCRGVNPDYGVLCSDTENELAESMQAYQTVQCDRSSLMPCRSDILVSYATQQGYSAYRDHHGSWFINAIAKIFAEFAHEEHVEEMMTRVRQAVMKKSGITTVDTTDNRTEYVLCKEMSESRSLLTKKVFLIPTKMSSDPLDA